MAQASTRDRILEEAMEMFAREGFRGTTISEIERRVGLAAGTGSLHRHFPSKEALLQAAVEHEVARCRAEIEATRSARRWSDDPVERRMQAFEQVLVDLDRFDRLISVMLHDGDRVPELREAVWNALRRPAASRRGPDDVVEAVALAALGGYHLFSRMQGRSFDDVDRERFVRTLLGLVGTGRDDHPVAYHR